MNDNNEPLVCICVPTYNSARTVSETIESLLAQTYKNIHILIVDNASTDGTVEIVKEYAAKNSNIKVHEFKEHVDGTQSCRRCVDLAYGSYTAIYHSDDVYENNIVEKEVEFFKRNPDVGAVFTSLFIIDEFGRKCGQHKIPPKLLGLCESASFGFNETFKAILKYGNYLACASAMVKTDIYKSDLSLWNEAKYLSANDVAVWLKILQNYKIGIINECLMQYRVNRNSFSYNYARTRTERHDVFILLDDYIVKCGKKILSNCDRINYKLLKIKDDVVRSINCLINGDGASCRRSLKEQFSISQLGQSVLSIRGGYLLVVCCIAYIMSYMPIGKYGRDLLYSFRYKTKFRFN